MDVRQLLLPSCFLHRSQQILEMPLHTLTATILLVLAGHVSGQFSFGRGFQTSNYPLGTAGDQTSVNANNFQVPGNQGFARDFSSNGEVRGENSQRNNHRELANPNVNYGTNVPNGYFLSPFKRSNARQHPRGNRFNHARHSQGYPFNRPHRQPPLAAPSNRLSRLRGNAPMFSKKISPLNRNSHKDVLNPLPGSYDDQNSQGSPINRFSLQSFFDVPSNQGHMGKVPMFSNQPPQLNRNSDPLANPLSVSNVNRENTNRFVLPQRNVFQKPILHPIYTPNSQRYFSDFLPAYRRIKANPSRNRNQPEFNAPNPMLSSSQGKPQDDDNSNQHAMINTPNPILSTNQENLQNEENTGLQYDEMPTTSPTNSDFTQRSVVLTDAPLDPSKTVTLPAGFLSDLDVGAMHISPTNGAVTEQTISKTINEATKRPRSNKRRKPKSKRHRKKPPLRKNTSTDYASFATTDTNLMEATNDEAFAMTETSEIAQSEIATDEDLTIITDATEETELSTGQNREKSNATNELMQTVTAGSEIGKTAEQSLDNGLNTTPFTGDFYSAVTDGIISNPDVMNSIEEIVNPITDSSNTVDTDGSSGLSTVTQSFTNKVTTVSTSFESTNVLTINSDRNFKEDTGKLSIATTSTLENTIEMFNSDEKQEATVLCSGSSISTTVFDDSESNFIEKTSTESLVTTAAIPVTVSSISETSAITAKSVRSNNTEVLKDEETTVAVNSVESVQIATSDFQTDKTPEQIAVTTPYAKYSSDEIKSIIKGITHDQSLRPYLDMLCGNLENSEFIDVLWKTPSTGKTKDKTSPAPSISQMSTQMYITETTTDKIEKSTAPMTTTEVGYNAFTKITDRDKTVTQSHFDNDHIEKEFLGNTRTTFATTENYSSSNITPGSEASSTQQTDKFSTTISDDIANSVASSKSVTDVISSLQTKEDNETGDLSTKPADLETTTSIATVTISATASTTQTGSQIEGTNAVTEGDGKLIESVTVTETTLNETTEDETEQPGPETCGEDEEWWDCIPLYHNTCHNFARARARQDFDCKPGCFCMHGLVKTRDGDCVDPDDCPDPVCNEGEEEETDCSNPCCTCEANCKPCSLQMCQPGCDCRDGYKRNTNGTCIHASECPVCTTSVPSAAIVKNPHFN